MPLRLLIADDERLFRQSLRKLLESEKDIKVVAEAADGQEAVLKAREKEPDIALLDVRMPKMDGIKAAKLIATVVPKTKILMLSIHDDDEKIISALKAGATGYILKDADQADFIEILRHTHAGKIHSSPYLAHLTLDSSRNHEDLSQEERERQFSEKYGLSDLELRVLQLVAEGLNNEEISRLTHVARETIKTHLKGLFRKLEVKNRTEAAVLAVREGLD
ncbi:MAG TPA: response regulator transcription factor [Candidatus Binatia bacterium]|jgi:DNA-binding NarL/FixJ family response regulator|nr:response regulator transcription factor [Candidatus Binatia bacterium]